MQDKRPSFDSLAYYIVFGDHVPGASNLWRDFHEKRREKVRLGRAKMLAKAMEKYRFHFEPNTFASEVNGHSIVGEVTLVLDSVGGRTFEQLHAALALARPHVGERAAELRRDGFDGAGVPVAHDQPAARCERPSHRGAHPRARADHHVRHRRSAGGAGPGWG